MSNSALKKFTGKAYFPAIILIIVCIIVAVIIIPNFFSARYLRSFLTSYTPAILLAVAQCILLLGGSFDISIGPSVSVTSVVMILLIESGWALPAAVFIGLLVGILIGMANGFIVAYLNVTPLLSTIGMTSLLNGLALFLMPTPKGTMDKGFVGLYQTVYFPLILIVIAALVIWGVWKFTPLKLKLLAVGNNESRAFVSGINVRKIKFLTFVFSGFIAAIAALAMLGNTGGGNALIGEKMSMNSVAACVIGGVSISGGSGDVAGAITGSIFLSLAFNIVASSPIPYSFQTMISGLIVLGGILLSMMVQKRNMKAE